MWRAWPRAHPDAMNMNNLTLHTYVADHQARLLADARRSRVTVRRHSIRQLFSRTRRPSVAPEVQPTVVAASAC